LKTVLRIYLFWLLLFSCLVPLTGTAVAGEKLVGVIMTGKSPYYTAMHDAFAASTKAWLPAGDSVKFILQRPFPDSIAMANAARKLIASEVDIIIAYGASAARAVLDEKSMIPVVYAGVYDPESALLAGAHITGVGYKIPISSLLRHLKTIKQIDSISVIYNSLEEDSVRQTKELEPLTLEQQILLKKIDIKSRRDLAEISSLKTTDGSFITGSSVVCQWLEDIMPAIVESGQPTVSVLPDHEESGIIITLAHNPAIQGKKAAEMAGRVLAGERPENISPELLRETELVFNLRAAKALDLKVPIKLIADATKVIR